MSKPLQQTSTAFCNLQKYACIKQKMLQMEKKNKTNNISLSKNIKNPTSAKRKYVPSGVALLNFVVL